MGRYKVDPITGELTLMNPSMSDIPIYQGVSGSTASVSGLVPQAQAGDEEKALLGNGTWGAVSGGETISYADWLQLTPEEQAHGEYFIPDWSGSILPVGGIDSVPTEDSQNLVMSGGVYESVKETAETIANIESTTTSTHAYSIGQQFILNGVLHIATAAISVGDTLAVGTNCAINQSITEQIKTIVDAYVTGVKGNSETNYRKGNVNLTPANLGLGTETNNFKITKGNYVSQAMLFSVKVDNTENTLNGHNLSLITYNDGLLIWDDTDSQVLWSCRVPLAISRGGTGVTSSTDFITHTTVTKSSISIPAGGVTDALTIALSKSGYYPLGIIGYYITGTNSTFATIPTLNLSSRASGSGTLNYRIRNNLNLAVTLDFGAHILWVKK